ncbi:MAG: class II aldolase/adducin family protein [Rhodospirillales bacterium]
MSLHNRFSKEEWEARVNLAACGRLLDYFGLAEMTNNHISTRVPGKKNQILLNNHNYFMEEISASNILKIDLDGNIVEGPKDGLSNAAFVLHSGIYKTRPDVNAIVHTHTNAGMAVSALDCGLLPLFQHSFDFYMKVAYHDYAGSASEFEDEERVVSDLGPHRAMIMHNHGLLSCGVEVSHAFNLMFRLDKCCRAQIMALATGETLHEVAPDVRMSTKAFFTERANFSGARSWPGHLRRLDRIDASYRQ